MTAKKKSETGGKTGTQRHFGFKPVAEGARQTLVNDVFTSVAGKYDFMNDAMSLGLHRLWKDHLINRLRPKPGMRLLDIAGGTGDIAFKFLKSLKAKGAIQGAPVTVFDINPDMLEHGRARALDKGFFGHIDWVTGNAEKLPFKNESFEAATITFGIRNVTRLEKAIAETYRVLKPGGQYLVMEFSSVPSPLMKDLYDWYSFHVIPKLGKTIADDEEAYKYLVESIRKFPPPEIFAGLLRDAGFKRVGMDPLAGGVVTLYSGRKI